MVTGELVAERARTLLPWGGSGRSRALGLSRAPGTHRPSLGGGTGSREMVKGAGRGKVGEESFFCNLAVMVYSPKGCCGCSVMGSSLPLEASIKNTMQTNTHKPKLSLCSIPALKSLCVERQELAKKGQPPKPNSMGGLDRGEPSFSLSFFIAICN